MKLKIRKIHPEAIIPQYATPGASGLDLHARIPHEIYLQPGVRFTVPTGIAIELPNGFVAAMERLFPDMDLRPLCWVSSDLSNGKLMSEKKVLAAKRTLKEIEDRMVKSTWQQVMDATQTTQIEIEMEQLGLKAA